MTIEKLERVMWRIRKRNPGKDKVLLNELKRAIMYEVGTDMRTYYVNKKSLMTLGWIKSYKNKHIILTNEDLTES